MDKQKQPKRILSLRKWRIKYFVELVNTSNAYTKFNFENRTKRYFRVDVPDIIFSHNTVRKMYHNCYKHEIEKSNPLEENYELFEMCFEITTNNWQDVDSLGVTRHHETDWINSVFVTAKNSNIARRIGALELDKQYHETRSRRNKNQDLYLFKNPEKLFPILNITNKNEIKLMMQCSLNVLGKPFNFHTTRNSIEKQHDFGCESLVRKGLMVRVSVLGKNQYQLTKYAIDIVKILLPIKDRQFQYDNILPLFQLYKKSNKQQLL